MTYSKWLEKRRKLDAEATKGPWEVSREKTGVLRINPCGTLNGSSPRILAKDIRFITTLRNEHSQVLDVLEEMRDTLVACAPSWLPAAVRDKRRQALENLDELGEK